MEDEVCCASGSSGKTSSAKELVDEIRVNVNFRGPKKNFSQVVREEYYATY